MALDQAGGYIEETGCGVENYLDLWLSHRAQLLAQRPRIFARLGIHYGHLVTILQRIGKVAARMRRALETSSVFAFGCHPDRCASQGTGLLGQELGALVADPWRLNELIKEAIKFSLLRRDPKSKALRMHRLIQTLLRDSIDPGYRPAYAERAVRVIEHGFPEAKFVNWPVCERLSAHA